jgi:hypothetical protein
VLLLSIDETVEVKPLSHSKMVGGAPDAGTLRTWRIFLVIQGIPVKE